MIILILSVSVGYTQNLVPNPSFETYAQCPDSINFGSVDICLISWTDPTNATSDYYNLCSSIPFFGIPSHNNGFAYQYPRTGDGMTGIIVFQGSIPTREYIHTQLIDSL